MLEVVPRLASNERTGSKPTRGQLPAPEAHISFHWSSGPMCGRWAGLDSFPLIRWSPVFLPTNESVERNEDETSPRPQSVFENEKDKKNPKNQANDNYKLSVHFAHWAMKVCGRLSSSGFLFIFHIFLLRRHSTFWFITFPLEGWRSQRER